MVEYIKLERQALSLELSIETRIFIVVDLNKRFQNKILMKNGIFSVIDI